MTVPYYPQITITPHLGLSLIGMDEVIAQDMVLIDAAFGVPPGSVALQTNGVLNTVQNILNLTAADGSMVLSSDAFGAVSFSSKAYADAHLNGALITGAITLGKIPIGQAGGNVVWADPVVQGVYADGATIAAPGAPGNLSTIQPVYVGGNKGGALTGLTLDGSGNLNVTIAAGIMGTLTNNNAAPASNNVGSLTAIANAVAPTYTEGDQVLLSVNLLGHQRVGTKTNNSAAPSAGTEVGVLAALATAASPSYTEGNQVMISCNLGGAQRIIGVKLNNDVAPSTQVGVMPSVANAAHPTWSEGVQCLQSSDLQGNQRVSLMNVAGTQLGTPTNFGTTPGAVVVPGVNASLFMGTVAVSSAAPLAVTLVALGATGGVLIATGSIAATATAIKSTQANLLGWTFFNSNVGPVYVQFFNVVAGSVVVGTTVPVKSVGVPAGSSMVHNITSGIQFSTAMSIAVTTSRTGSGAPSNTVDYNIEYA